VKIVAVGSLVFALASIALPASPSFVPTNTKAYTQVEYHDLGPVNATMPMSVVVGLALRHRPLVDVILQQQVTPGSPLYGKFLTRAQTLQTFSPTGAQMNAVATYLAANGFTNIRATADNVLITADAKARNVQAAFNTKVHWICVFGQCIYANVTPALVPSSLGGVVEAIEGLNNFSMSSLRRVRAGGAAENVARAAGPGKFPSAVVGSGCTQVPIFNVCVTNAFGPRNFATVYDAAGAASGANTKIAVFTEGNLLPVTADLRSFESLNGLPQVPYRIVSTGPPSSDTSGTTEWDLDTQYASGMAQTVRKLLLYNAPSLGDADTTVAFSRFESDDIAKAASASFGSCEIFPAMDGTLVVDDEIFALAALHGQTVFAASGDNGTTCPLVSSTGVPGTGLPAQTYPGTSPYAVSVGGTTVLSNADYSYSTEVAWIGSGGGMSTEESAPFWQQGIVPNVPSPPLPGVRALKGVPDIAMAADPNTGANVVVAGSQTQIGGTSLAAPLALGVWARLETYGGNRLGFAAPLLYKEYADLRTPANARYVPPPLAPRTAFTQPIGGFHDILVGTNGLPSFPEYDYATGLGTLDTALQNSDITL